MKVISGSPGTGKHTIAKILAKKFGLELVDASKIALSEGIAEKKGGALEVDVKKLKKIIDKKNHKNMLLVGHLAPYAISKNNVEFAVILRRSPYSLERTYRKRRYARKKSAENLGAEILGVIYYDTVKRIGRRKTFQFDTTNESVSSTARRVEKIFAGSRPRDDRVDWLRLVSNRGDLRRFFPY